MAGNEQRDTTDTVRAQILSQAHRQVARRLAASTRLTPTQARDLAVDLVDAAAPSVRAEYAQQLSGMTGAQATRRGAAALGVLALDLTVFAVVAVRGPRWARPVAVAALAAHAAFFTANKRHVDRIRAAARAQTVRDGIRSVA